MGPLSILRARRKRILMNLVSFALLLSLTPAATRSQDKSSNDAESQQAPLLAPSGIVSSTLNPLQVALLRCKLLCSIGTRPIKRPNSLLETTLSGWRSMGKIFGWQTSLPIGLRNYGPMTALALVASLQAPVPRLWPLTGPTFGSPTATQTP